MVLLLIDEIEAGIEFIKSKMNPGRSTEVVTQLKMFWSYFKKNWLKRSSHYQDKTGNYLFTSWNISHLIDAEGNVIDTEDGAPVMVNRTNNPLERFNRRMNEEIPSHPTMQVFVEGIKRIANDYVDVMNSIKKARGKKIYHAPVHLPLIPKDFLIFKATFKSSA